MTLVIFTGRQMGFLCRSAGIFPRRLHQIKKMQEEIFVSKELRHWLLHETGGKIFFTFACALLVWLLLKFIKAAVLKSVKDNDKRYRSRKLLDFFGFVVVFIVMLFVFSGKWQNIAVALGIAGAGITFALQELIASVAGWLAVMFGGFYKTGDRVQLGGIKGDVIDIGVLRTTLMELGEWVDGDLYNGRIVRVSNSFVFKEPVFNYSGDFEFLWDEIKIPIQYGSNFDRARQLLVQIAGRVCAGNAEEAQHMWNGLLNKYLVENASTEPAVSLKLTDDWVEFTIRYIVNYQKRRITKDRLFSEILREVGKTNGEINFASMAPQSFNKTQIHF